MASDAKRAQQLFLAAIEQPNAAARAALLGRECDDPELRARVEALLAAHDASGSFLDAPAADRIGACDTTPGERPLAGAPLVTPLTGAVLAGRYKLLEKIGEGGMGSVWVAQQAAPVRRVVAVKLIKAGMDSRQVLARFEAERQALALMDHPHIAKVLDAGSAPDGRPFFVMELVKGVPITRFCDERRLTPRERLELFVPVCQAIQHAHQKGIIHRDVKPSNVLVALYDDRPVPKVIDFGVAKAAGQALTEQTLMTAFGAVVGTPEYMSPEQASFNQLDVDTRSDVYSLGVLLYELLTGSPPFSKKELDKAGLLEVFRLIREQDPPRPSTRLSAPATPPDVAAARGTEPSRLAGLVRGELDWIVMRALEKDRSRRYETANGLAADVQRYLAGEPVQAAPPGATYRLRKLARKHRGPLVAAAVVLLALVGGLVGTAWQARQAELAREAEAKRAEGEKQARQEAVEAADRLREARDELRSNLYAARSRLIQGAWEADNAGLTRDLLAEQVPGPDEPDLRHFEWHYWDRQAHAELAVLPLPGFAFMGKFIADGTRLVGIPKPDGKSGTSGMATAGVWDAATGRPLSLLALHDDQEAKRIGNHGTFGVTPDGALFSQRAQEAPAPGAEGEGVMYYWDVATSKRRHRIAGLGPDAQRVVLSEPTNQLLWWTADPRKGVKPTLHARDLAGGKDLYTLSPPADFVSMFALSRDGAWMAAALTFKREPGPQVEFWVWSAADGNKKFVCGPFDLPPSLRENNAGWAAFSPDAARLAVGLNGALGPQPLAVWDVAAGKEVYRTQAALNSGNEQIQPFSPDGRLLATFSGSVIEVRDATTGRLRQSLRGHSGAIWDVAFTGDGSRLHSCGYDQTVRVWDARAVQSADPVPLADAGIDYAIVASGDGNRFTTKVKPGPGKPRNGDVLAVWDRSGRRLATVGAPLEHELNSNMVPAVSLDQQGRRVVYSAMLSVFAEGRHRSLGQLYVWDVDTGRPLLTRSEWGGYLGCALSPDGSRVASIFAPEGSTTGTAVTVWEVETGREVRRFDAPEAGGSVALSPDGSWLALYRHGPARTTDVLTAWELGTGEKAWEVATPSMGQQLGLLAYSPDGRRLARPFSGFGAPGVVEVLDAGSGRHVCLLRGHSQAVASLRFSPDGRRIITSDDQSEVKFWDAESGKNLLDLKRPGSERLHALTFTPDGHRVVGLSSGGKGIGLVEWDGTPRPVRP